MQDHSDSEVWVVSSDTLKISKSKVQLVTTTDNNGQQSDMFSVTLHAHVNNPEDEKCYNVLMLMPYHVMAALITRATHTLWTGNELEEDYRSTDSH